MSASVMEAYEERHLVMNQAGNYTRVELVYVVSGVSTEYEAIEKTREAVPSYRNSLPLSSLEICEMLSTTHYKVRAVYQKNAFFPDNDSQTEESVVSFNCGAGKIHLTHSRNQTRIYGNTDAGGMIGWNGKFGSESEIEGVDVPYPQLRESYTKKIRLSGITAQYKRNLAALVGCVNQSAWKGWQAGEVMFLGWHYEAPIKGAETVVATYHFSIRLNEVIQISGSTCTKNGHDYLWTLNKTAVDGSQLKLVPDSIYLERVANYADFSVLGL